MSAGEDMNDEEEQNRMQERHLWRILASLDAGAKNSGIVGLSAMDRNLLTRILKEAWDTHPLRVAPVRCDVLWLLFFGDMKQTFRSKGVTRSARGGGGGSAADDSAVDVDAMLLEAQEDIKSTEGATPFQLVNMKTKKAVPLLNAPIAESMKLFYEQRRKEIKFRYHTKTAMSTTLAWEPAEEIEEGDWMLVTEEGLMAPFGGKRADYALLSDFQLKSAVKNHHYMSFGQSWYLERNPGGDLLFDKYDRYGICQMTAAEIRRDGYPIGEYPTRMHSVRLISKKSESSAHLNLPNEAASAATLYATDTDVDDLLPRGVVMAVSVKFKDMRIALEGFVGGNRGL